MLVDIYNYLTFTLQTISIVLLGWVHLMKSGSIFIYAFWQKKFGFDKAFFILLFLQFLLSGFSWFEYDVKFYDTPESVTISPKWNFFFISISLLNFFFLGFWQNNWNRIWFFSSQLLLLILLLWGYLEPNRYFFDFIDVKEISYRPVFYLFALISLTNIILGYLTFQEEDTKFQIEKKEV
ncbi:MAG: hypothetical protein SH817_13530 [Leptospira sp.]|nr:hypothetical protein [Leptospira sp.]